MSVLIRGMKMPKCCDVCQFSGWSNLHQTALCKVRDYEPCFEDFSREYTSKRSNSCPLVGTPDKHGRLIDQEEVSKMITNPYEQREVMKQVIDAPTVIEEE